MHIYESVSPIVNIYLSNCKYLDMPAISIRGTEMPASPIRKLAPLADAAKQRGVHVFHLNIGQPDLPTPQVAIDAIRNIDRKVLEYSPSAGDRKSTRLNSSHPSSSRMPSSA